MAFQVKVDEDLPSAVVAMLHAKGYEAVGVLQQGMQGWKDPELWQAVQSEGRFLVTADKGFADARTHPPGSHAGVLLLRPDEQGIRPLIRLMEEVLAQYTLDHLAGAIAVVTPRGIRVRRKPVP
jgi:predicted nuclease of predicted toxin-antitoxin system